MLPPMSSAPHPLPITQEGAESVEFAAGFSNSKVLWMFAWLIIASVMMFAYGFYRQFERNAIEAVEHELSNLSILLADDFSQDALMAREQVLAIGLRLQSQSGSLRPDEVARLVNEVAPSLPRLGAWAWQDMDARIQPIPTSAGESSELPAELIAELNQQSFKPSTSGRALTTLLFSPKGMPYLAFGVQLRDRTGRSGGALIGMMSLDVSPNAYKSLTLGQAGRVTVFSQDGRLVSTFPRMAERPAGKWTAHPTFQRIADGKRQFFRGPSILKDRDVYISAGGIQDLPLLMLVSREADEARAGLAAQAAYIFAVALALCIAILLFTGMFGRQLRQREAAEGALAESRRSLLTAQRVARLGSWTLNMPEGSIEYSELARDILDLPAEHRIGTGLVVLNQVIHPDDRVSVRAAFRRAMTGQVVEGEFRIMTPGGRVKWLRSRTEVQFGANRRAEQMHGTIQDITQIKEAQLRLAESEREYRVLSDNMRDLVSLHELDGTLRFASNSFKRITGYSPTEIVGRSFYLWLHPDDVQALRTELDRQLRLGRVELHTEFRYRHQAGHFLWLECLAASVHDREGRMTHIQASSRDVTERRRALSALRESEERFRRIIEFTSDLYWETDAEYRFTQLSMGAQKYLGIVPRSIGTRRWENPFYDAPNEVWEAHKADIAARRPFKDLIITMVDPELGKMLEYTSISGEPFYDDDGKFRGYRGIGRFITQQKKYELDLAERTRQLSDVNAELSKEASRRRELERRLLLAIEKELAQVGLELHDELGQNLTGTALLAKTLQKKLAEKGVPEAADAARVHALVNETIRQTRLISHGLSPHIMGPDGLVEALQQLADDVNSLGIIDCRFECDGEPEITDPLIARGLYRIAQEAVNNALKHAHAKNIMIELTALGEETRLAVIDNGIGIRSHDAEPLSDSALHSIKYRSGVMGASLSVSRRPGGGTEIAVALPADAAASAPANLRENG